MSSSSKQQHPPLLSDLNPSPESVSSSTYVFRNMAGSLAAGAIASPALLFYFSITGAIDARFPNTPSTSPVIHTFGSLAISGIKTGIINTGRMVLWCGITAGVSSALREQIRVGPRYEVDPLSNPLFHLTSCIGGASAAHLLTLDWRNSMPGPRRFAFLLLSGGLGVGLPLFLSRVGPGVRRKIADYTSSSSSSSLNQSTHTPTSS
jgi:hypothetical protein